jgi:hypothetical protein
VSDRGVSCPTVARPCQVGPCQTLSDRVKRVWGRVRTCQTVSNACGVESDLVRSCQTRVGGCASGGKHRARWACDGHAAIGCERPGWVGGSEKSDRGCLCRLPPRQGPTLSPKTVHCARRRKRVGELGGPVWDPTIHTSLFSLLLIIVALWLRSLRNRRGHDYKLETHRSTSLTLRHTRSTTHTGPLGDTME